MRFCTLPVLLAFFFGAPLGTALAQTAQTAVPEVVVQGRRDGADAARKFVEDVTVDISDKNGDRQIATLDQAVCPFTLGLTGPQNAAVASRLLQDAKDAGLRVASPGCDPNVVVIIADTGRQFLTKLHGVHPAIFGAMSGREIEALLAEVGPVHAWRIMERLDRDGTPLGLSADGSFNQEPIPQMNGLPYQAVYLWSPSILQKSVRQTIDSSFLLLDANALDGLSLTQIADYAAMRTLAVTRAPKTGSNEKGTILALFDQDQKDAKPERLSPADAAYLHALYSTSNTLSGVMQKTSMANMIRRTEPPPTPVKSAQ